MKSKILSILLLLVVVSAFSGVASAASHQVLVKEAWDEKIIDEAAWNETIPEIPAIPEITHIEQQLVSGAAWLWHCDIYDWVDAVYEGVVVVDTPEQIINHPAVYETVTVVDEAAWNESVLVTPASDKFVGEKVFSNKNGAEGYGQAKINSGEATSYTVTKTWECYHYIYVVKLFKHVDAVYQVVEHPAVTHEEQVLVSEAWDEVIPEVNHVEYRLVSEGHYQFLGHMDIQTAPNYNQGYNDMISQCSAAYPGWDLISHPHDDIAAVYENIVIVDVPGVPAVPGYVIEHPEVSHILHHEAVYATVEDPVIPIKPVVDDPVTPVADEPVSEEIPMQPIGGAAAGIVGAALAILGGFIIAAYRRRDDEDEE